MEPIFLVTLVSRWLHILAAALALGVPIYVRYVLMPAMGQLEEGQRNLLREAVAKRWRMIVHILIIIFLLTGFWTFLGYARWKDPSFTAEMKFRYHLLFGIKVVIALAMFFISSALAGRSAALAGIRANAKLWIGVLIVLGLVIVGISGFMRFI